MVHDFASEGQLRASPVAFMCQAQDDGCKHLTLSDYVANAAADRSHSAQTVVLAALRG